MSKVTIEDISRQTGLSRGTISRALNDRPDISAATKERVLEACLKLNYVPSHAARSLATGRNFAVAVIVPDLRCPFSAALLRGAIARADAAQYVVHAVDLGSEARSQSVKLRQLSSERIDSVLLAVPVADSTLAELRERLGNRPLVTCNGVHASQFDTYCVDDREAGRMAARRIARAGGKTLYVQWASSNENLRVRGEGFAEVALARGESLEDHAVTIDNNASRLVERLRDVSGIVAADIAAAIQVLLACASVGRTPGKDVALVAIGDEPIAARIRPTITAVDLSPEELGRSAMDGLLQRLTDGRTDNPRCTIIPPRVVERESTQHLPPT